MREIRMALLDADVNFEIAKDFIASVKQDCLGEDVLKSVTPGQQVVKIVHDRLIELMGESEAPLNLKNHPSVIMMVGLHGSGKTTSSAKLAVNLKKRNKKVMLVAGDIYRPAAIDQLETLAKQIDAPIYVERGNPNVAVIARNAIEQAKRDGVNVVIIDTAGRLQIDEQMVQELVQVNQVSNADEIMLVADAALGQEAVSVADHFHKALGLTGVVLTKLDGDARGGAALSIRKVTGRPIKFVGLGERIEDFETFHPDRMASRILGMGDIVSLVEKASEKIDREEAEKLKNKLQKNTFDFNDFLGQLRQMKKLGGVESILKMLPGGKQLSEATDVAPEQFKQMEAIICSMTMKERENADIIDFPRRKRIAKGSGTSLEQVGQLIKQFSMMKKMMKKTGLLGRLMSGGMDMGSLMGGMGGLGGMGGGMGMGGGIPSFSRGSNRTVSKKKNRKKHKKKR
jgi:signal recognition particle subunit SRP54